MNRNTATFLVLCVIWGTTWIGIKAGIATVPPLMFAGTRFTVAGLLILSATRLRGAALPRVAKRSWPRLFVVTLFMIPLCYGPLFWGMLYVDTGTAAVLELSLTPVTLLGFALLLGDERYDGRRLFAILLGAAGLCVLFGPEAYASWTHADQQGRGLRLLAMTAVASAALIYAWGSVLARPLLEVYSSDFIAGFTTLFGGAFLILISLVVEPGATAALKGNWGWPAWVGWLFLVLFGSFIGYTLFIRLLHEIGASRAGAFAFVSPVIAVVLGIITYGEEVSLIDIIGMAIMLFAAFLALRERKQETSSASPPLIPRSARADGRI
ncbi:MULTISPECIES: EamA family transporter [unclassified Mesorhizobium]|uniref:DMT family transporter n=1 Tax=unclassified Mesorhizobium TaxID=325217 RepID=UPI0003D069E7|nr:MULTISPECIES: EamA family transporter [unclassified Mesorhizobium]ESZ07813.1 multidrug transporter [Mesorhizobium sp. L2C089B000]ESZ33684.1 multidrug transporter [Mesorhizobium sp. L2C067A000]